MPVLERSLEFVLPGELEAHEPPEARGLRRDEVRLLVSSRSTDVIHHARFTDLPDFLTPADLVVLNNSGTLPAELDARLGNLTFPLRLSTRLGPNLWVIEPREIPVAPGDRFDLPAGGSAAILGPYLGSRRLWIARLDLPGSLLPYLLQWGRPIRYPYVPDRWPLDLYQTVYAREMGSAEMPSAGRAFTPEVIERLHEKGVGVATITLHTGVSSLEGDELPYPEYFRVGEAAVAAIRAARAAGGRVIAVGTTVVRALESATAASETIHAAQGWTDLVIDPARGVYVVAGLLTGFHEPRSTHLAMLEAIAGPEHLERSYRAAIAERYLWHEFGDLYLILP